MVSLTRVRNRSSRLGRCGGGDRTIGHDALPVNGFLFNIGSALDCTSKDGFKNGNSSWVIITGAYFNL